MFSFFSISLPSGAKAASQWLKEEANFRRERRSGSYVVVEIRLTSVGSRSGRSVMNIIIKVLGRSWRFHSFAKGH